MDPNVTHVTRVEVEANTVFGRRAMTGGGNRNQTTKTAAKSIFFRKWKITVKNPQQKSFCFRNQRRPVVMDMTNGGIEEQQVLAPGDEGRRDMRKRGTIWKGGEGHGKLYNLCDEQV